MKINGNFILISVCIVLILIGSVVIAGCASSSTPTKSSSQTASTNDVPTSSVQTNATPNTTSIPVPTTSIPKITTSLSNGIIISYPANWEKQELSETSLREYGRVTTNIVNFYSPSETDYTTVSIDVDPQPVSDSDSDQYFNLATVAIQKELGNIEITLHRQEGPGYKGPSECDDCKAVYNLEFKSNAGSRWYQFINDDGTFIIITMKNPIPSHSDLLEMLASIKIPPSVHQKQR